MEVTLENWQVGPANRWAYHHVDEVVPTVPVACGAAPSALPAAPLELDALYAEHLAGAYVDGVVVLHRGALAFGRYEAGITPASLHLSQSVGKSVLGLLVGVLVARGAFAVEDRVTDHVPEVAGSGYAGATVAHLLDMTAAVDFDESYENFWRYDLACGWFPPRPGEPPTILDYLPGIAPADWNHGERFSYVTPNTDLLGIVAERAGGAPLAELIAQHLWQPLGAERDALLTVDPAGTGVISGGFCATARDFARLGQLVLDEGRGIVAPEWIAALGHGDPAAWGRRAFPDRDEAGGTDYGLQWWTQDGRPTAWGIHGQTVTVDRAGETVVAILSSWPAATDPVHDDAQRAFVRDVIRQSRS